MTFPQLETGRMRLVQIGTQHTGSYFDIMSREEVTRFYGMDALKEQKEAASMIASIKNTYESKRGIRWGLILKETGKFAGTAGLNNMSLGSKRAEIGYELHPSYWGKGLTTEAVKAVLHYSFEDLGLFRIGAVTYPQNTPSIRLLKRLGFQKEGDMRGYLYQDNQSHDAFLFSLLKTDWEKQ